MPGTSWVDGKTVVSVIVALVALSIVFALLRAL